MASKTAASIAKGVDVVFMVGMIADLWDPAGFGQFVSNEDHEKMRDLLESTLQKQLKKYNIDPPFMFNLNTSQWGNIFNSAKVHYNASFASQTIDNIQKKNESVLKKYGIALKNNKDDNDPDVQAFYKLYASEQEKIINSQDSKKRDQQIYNNMQSGLEIYKKTLTSDQLKKYKNPIELVPFLSTKKTYGISQIFFCNFQE